MDIDKLYERDNISEDEIIDFLSKLNKKDLIIHVYDNYGCIYDGYYTDYFVNVEEDFSKNTIKNLIMENDELYLYI